MTDPYPHDRAYVRDELARLDRLLRREVERFDGPIDEFGALYVSEAEVRDLLSMGSADGVGGHQDPDGFRRHRGTDGVGQQYDQDGAGRHQGTDGGGQQGAGLTPLERHACEIDERRRATVEAGDRLRADRLVDRFGLADTARDALLVALAPDLDEKYATVYAYLQDDATRRRPTVGFLLGLLGPDVDQLEHRTLFTAGSPLVDDNLVAVPGDGPLPTREVRVDRRIAAYVLGEDAMDPALADLVTVRDPGVGLDGLPSDPDERDALAGLATPGSDRPPPMVAIHGSPGTGTDARVAALCGERGDRLITLDATGVASKRFAEVLDRVGREARLRDAAVHLADVLDEEAATVTAIRRLDDLPAPVYLTGEATPSNAVRTAPARRDLVAVAVERPDYDARRRYWADRTDLPAGVDPATIASTFRLSRGAIDDAMAMARANARAAGESLVARHVYEACRAQSSEELSEFATLIDPVYEWEDIILPPETDRQLREVANRITDGGTVYADWGFAEQSSLGNGLIALFSGPSGTGKTMAAEVVASHAGLHLYKVDLAAVVSKYVGETESNLGRIFDEAADSDAVLLFDEADALFGERSEVSDAHDRYANVEVDYLLQRVEEHDGAVLLTTNLESNIDDAFLRRIHLGVEFPHPDRSARAEIWQRVFPGDTPVGDLDYDFLARLDLTGGHIRNVALTAAFYAAEEDAAVRMEAVVRAVKREYQKAGIPIDPDRFGEYRHVIESP